MGKRIFCFVLSILCIFCCTACGGQSKATEPSQTPAPTQTQVQTEAPTEAVETTQPPENTAPETEPAEEDVVLHSGLRSDGSFNEGTVFIGDSLTYSLIYEYLIPNDLIGDAKYMAVVGAPLSAFFSYEFLLEAENGALYSNGFYGKNFSEALATVGEDATAIYLMLGTNFDGVTKESGYTKVVDYILEHCPNATVYLQLIPYSERPTVHMEYVNNSILVTLGHYQELGIARVMCIDTLSAIGINQQKDGIHLNAEGKELWYEEIVRFAEDNEIPE